MNGLEQLRASILNFTNKITAKLDLQQPLVSEVKVIPANQSISYDMTTLVTNPAAFDVMSTLIRVMVEDVDSTSPTFGFYVNSEGTVSVGLKPTGVVILHNHSAVDITARVRIDHPALAG